MIMSAIPRLQLKDPEILEVLEPDQTFKIGTLLDRSGYPPVGSKRQGWLAQSHLAFPPMQDSADPGSEMAMQLVRGGKMYMAATGGGSSGNGGHNAYPNKSVQQPSHQTPSKKTT